MADAITFNAFLEVPITVCEDGPSGKGTDLCFYKEREHVGQKDKRVLVFSFKTNDDMLKYVYLMHSMLSRVNEGLHKRRFET